MNQPINYGGCSYSILEHLFPLTENQIGGYYQGALFVSVADELKEQIRLYFFKWDIAEFVYANQFKPAALFKGVMHLFLRQTQHLT